MILKMTEYKTHLGTSNKYNIVHPYKLSKCLMEISDSAFVANNKSNIYFTQKCTI